jgi:hypothetical protein
VPEIPAAPPPRASLAPHALAFFLASLVLGAGVLFWAAARPYVDWPHVSDDMFYYLVLVRETAQHGVVSSDGLRPTNGFHPLYLLVLRPLHAVVPEPALPGAALALLAACHVGTCLVLWLTLRRLGGRVVAGLLAGLYAANPYVIGVVFAGVETALMCLCLSLSLWAHARWLEGGGRGDRSLALLALSLVVAGRTDMAVLGVALAAGPLLGRASAGGRWPPAASVARDLDRAPLMAAALPVLAFGVWGQLATGEFLQASGRSLSFWQSVGDWRSIRHALDLLGPLATPASALVYVLYAAVQFLAWLAKGPAVLMCAHPLGVLLARAGIMARFASGRTRPDPETPRQEAHRRLGRELISFLILLWGAYALCFRHCQGWYWHGSVYVSTLLGGLWLASPRALGHDRTGRLWARLPRGAATVGLLVAIGLAAVVLDPLRPRDWARTPAGMVAAAPLVPGQVGAHSLAHTASGEIAADPLAQVPGGATVGAFDTGRLAWEEPRLRVVNLDGLVNNGAFRALRARRIGQYMLSERVEWLFVNDKVVERFRPFGLDEWLARADLVGRDAVGVGLYRLR